MKTRINSIICVICLLFSSAFVLTSCGSVDAVGIVSAEINGDGELILVYSDGDEQNVGVVVGKDGEDGRDGTDGEDGEDGADGTLTITANGSSIPAAYQTDCFDSPFFVSAADIRMIRTAQTAAKPKIHTAYCKIPTSVI